MLMEKKVTVLNKWQAGAKSGMCNSDRMLKRKTKGRMITDGVIKI